MSPSPPPPPTPPDVPSRKLHAFATAGLAALACATELADRIARSAVSGSRPLTIAFSGGTTPAAMFRSLAGIIADDPTVNAGWARTLVFQVDERIAVDGDPARNANDLVASLLDPTGVNPDHRLLMPVGLADPASEYAATLRQKAPGGIDIAVLGLGDDGHTASLVPGDAVLAVVDTTVAVTDSYRGTRRVTLTRSALDHADLLVWLVAGSAKAGPLRRLLANDATIPAGLLTTPNQLVFADDEAAALVGEERHQ